MILLGHRSTTTPCLLPTLRPYILVLSANFLARKQQQTNPQQRAYLSSPLSFIQWRWKIFLWQRWHPPIYLVLGSSPCRFILLFFFSLPYKVELWVLSHVDIYSFYWGIFLRLCFWVVFVITRILLNQGSVPYILL